jgi:hypothetical protein
MLVNLSPLQVWWHLQLQMFYFLFEILYNEHEREFAIVSANLEIRISCNLALEYPPPPLV